MSENSKHQLFFDYLRIYEEYFFGCDFFEVEMLTKWQRKQLLLVGVLW
jgi:hypothetical protein